MLKKEGDVELTMVIELVDEILNQVKDSMSLPILELPLNGSFSINPLIHSSLLKPSSRLSNSSILFCTS